MVYDTDKNKWVYLPNPEGEKMWLGNTSLPIIVHDDELYLAYRETINNKAKVKVYNSTTQQWQNLGGFASRYSIESILFLNLAEEGTPFVAYKNNCLNSKGATVMKYNGTKWEQVGDQVSTTISLLGGLVVDNDTPYIVYKDNGFAELKKYDGEWITVGSGLTRMGNTLDFCMSNGTPYVAYTENNKAVVMTLAAQAPLPALTNVKIMGIAKYGEKLTVNVTYSAQPDENPVLIYQWKRDGQDIPKSTDEYYTLEEEDIGKIITVTVTADGITAIGSLTSQETAAVQKADGPAKPSAPILSSKTHNSVTLVGNYTYQYSKDDGDTWQDTIVFSGLSPVTEYSFVARVKETATHYASDTGDSLSVITDRVPSSGSSGGGGGGTLSLVISTANPQDGITGMAYTHIFKARGGRTPYVFTLTNGTLPEGLTLTEDGILSGTPTAAGNYKFTITVKDHNGRTSRHTFTNVVKEGVLGSIRPKKVIILTVNSLLAYVDGQPFILDAEPFIDTIADRTLVPLRFIGEALGARIDWNSITQQVTIEDSGQEIILTIGSNVALANGAEQLLDCSPVILPPGRTFVPLRFICETLEAKVDYNNENRKITINR